jgi:aspartate/methionine/tyrosine aminotransferase
MNIKPFKLERYFAKYEFSAPYLLSPSDCEPFTLKELLSIADDDSKKLYEEMWLGYTESKGLPPLREEISKLYSTITADDVLVLIPEEGIFIAMSVLLEKGDHVITTYPGYQSLYEIAQSSGCEVTKWEIDDEGENWNFNIDKLKSYIKTNTKLIVINFPHNPTGFTPSKDEFESILHLAKENNIIVLSDEMYRFLEHDGANRLDSASDLYENAISLFGVSKTFALAGLRIGWLTTRNKEIYNKFATFKDYTTICSSAPSEILALIALRQKRQVIERNLNIINTNLGLLEKFFDKYSSIFSWKRPKAGTIAFPKLKGSIKIDDFCTDLVEKKGVMLLPASTYDYDGNNFRIGFGRKNMPEALEKLEEYLEENTQA